MKKKLQFKFLIVVIALWGTADTVSAQNTLGLNVGSQGVGIEGKKAFNSRLGLRLGVNIIPINNIETKQYLGENQTTINFEPRFSNVHVMADWRPFKFNSSNPLSGNFKVSAGVAYFIKSQGTANISLSNTYYYGDIDIPSEDVGSITAEAKWGHVAPYAGLGLDNIPMFNNFFLGFEAGTYYLSSPSATIVGTGFLKDNDQNQPQLQRNLKSYRFLPVFQVNFNFNIK